MSEPLLNAMGIISMNTTETTVPMIMNGILFPILVLTLSDRDPKKGSRNKAVILSSDIIIFMTNCLSLPIISSSISGTSLL